MLNLDVNDLGATLWILLLYSSIFLAIFFYFYRDRILSVFDPLVILAVGQAAYCVIALSILHSTFLLFQFFASQAALVFGFLSVRKPRFREGTIDWTSSNISIAECTVFLLFLVLLFANIWMGASEGFPIFSNNPSLSKVSLYTGGLGWVKRVNAGIGIFVPAGALLLAIRGKHKAIFGVVFLFCILLASVGGSKGALVIFLNMIGYVVYRRDLVSDILKKRLQRISIVLLVAALSLAVTVLYVVTRDLSLAAATLLQRILLQGDSIIYYYDPHVLKHFASYGPSDYLYVVLNGVLAELRLVPYLFPLGYQMVSYYWGGVGISDIVTGPNTPFFIVGHVYFGAFFGVVYCGVVGYIVARIRSLFLEAKDVSPLQLIYFLTLALLVFNFPTEVNLFTSPLLDMSIMVFIAVTTSRFLLFVSATTPRRISGYGFHPESGM